MFTKKGLVSYHGYQDHTDIKYHHGYSPVHSEETTVLEIVLDYDVSNSVEHELYVVGVSSAGEVRVNLLQVLAFVQILKL